MINPHDDCPHAHKHGRYPAALTLSSPYQEQIPRQEIVVKNQSALHTLRRAAARFAGEPGMIDALRQICGSGFGSSFADRTT
jgi:hypothetical protein